MSASGCDYGGGGRVSVRECAFERERECERGGESMRESEGESESECAFEGEGVRGSMWCVMVCGCGRVGGECA